MSVAKPEPLQNLPAWLVEGISAASRRIADEEAEAAAERVRERVRETVLNLVARTAAEYAVRTMGNKLIISVEMKT